MGEGPPVERPYLVKGQLLNRKYEIQDDINTGSFGHVILCRDKSNGGVKVAVKVQDRPEPRYHQGDCFVLLLRLDRSLVSNHTHWTGNLCITRGSLTPPPP